MAFHDIKLDLVGLCATQHHLFDVAVDLHAELMARFRVHVVGFALRHFVLASGVRMLGLFALLHFKVLNHLLNYNFNQSRKVVTMLLCICLGRPSTEMVCLPSALLYAAFAPPNALCYCMGCDLASIVICFLVWYSSFTYLRAFS